MIPAKLYLRRLPGEEWREAGAVFTGYLISSCGRWYSVKNKQLLKQTFNNAGYMRAQLSLSGKKKNVLTHIRVCVVFGDKNGAAVPPSLVAEGLSIDHLDGNKRNNGRANLEIIPHSENVRRFYERQRRSHDRPLTLTPPALAELDDVFGA